MLRPLLDFTFALVLKDYLFTGAENIRLGNGLDDCFGTVEVMYNDTWQAVCDVFWDCYDAAKVCRLLGCGRAISAHGQVLFVAGSSDKERDSSISKCSSLNNTNDCIYSKNANVLCSASIVVIIAGVVIAVLLILSALLIIFLVKRRRKQKKLQICSFSNNAVILQNGLYNDQDDENDDNDYEIADMDYRDHEDHEDSDSEQVYVNVDQDDSEEDYVNADLDFQQDYANMESDDSEQDYVNAITEKIITSDKNC